MNATERNTKLESLVATLIEKRARLAELKANGRYGYQLRQPRLACNLAAEALAREFPEECRKHRVCP